MIYYPIAAILTIAMLGGVYGFINAEETALTTITQGLAYLLTLSSYVEAVKQVEILFAMAIGALVFEERQQVREIAPCALVMLAGMVLLAITGAR